MSIHTNEDSPQRIFTVPDLQPPPHLASARARVYKERTATHKAARILRRMMFRADTDLVLDVGLIQLETAENQLLKLLD